jgi:hypothetical protein
MEHIFVKVKNPGTVVRNPFDGGKRLLASGQLVEKIPYWEVRVKDGILEQLPLNIEDHVVVPVETDVQEVCPNKKKKNNNTL